MRLSDTRVLLVHPGIYADEQAYGFAPWGVLCVGAALREEGAEVRVLDLNGADIPTVVTAAIEDFSPDVVGVTAKLGLGARRMREVVGAVRAVSGARILAGGPLVASFPDPAHPLWEGVDALVAGDGEQAAVEWIAAGCPSGARRAPEVDLDRLGIPDWWEPLDRYVHPAVEWPNMEVEAMHVAAGRGCTRRCTFCYLHTQYPETRFRFVSPRPLVDSLDRLHDRLGVRGFYFVDDCFVDVSRAHTSELCRILRARGAPYRLGCDIQLSELGDRALLTELHAAGFRCFYLGVEAASPTVRRRLGKAPLAGDCRDAIRRVTDMGFYIRASIGIGWPGESLREMQATLDLVDALPDLLFDAYRYTPLPGVPLTRRSPARAVAHPFEDYSEWAAHHADLPEEDLTPVWEALVARQDARRERVFGAG